MWKDILKSRLEKMPMPLDTRVNRDEEYKQAIIEYEKSVIEPKLTAHIRSRPATEGRSIFIGFNQNNVDDVGTNRNNYNYYTIGTDAIEKLGNNRQYILKVIGDLYKAEGYTVDNTYTFNNMVAIMIKEKKE